MAVFLFLAVMFAIANFYYWAFRIPLKTYKLFIIFFIVISLIAVITDPYNLPEIIIVFSGYYILLFGVHLLLTQVFQVNRYFPYLFVFFLISLLVTAFFGVLMQDIFNYS